MGAVLVDTLSASKKLVQAGMPEKQAEAVVTVINDSLVLSAVNKLDLERVRLELSQKIESVEVVLNQKIDSVEAALIQKIESVEARLDQKIDSLEAVLRAEMVAMENRMRASTIKWMVGILFTQTLLLVGIIELLLH